jgi:hypothetical protein
MFGAAVAAASATSAMSLGRRVAARAIPLSLAGGAAYTLASRGVANADKASGTSGGIKPIK